MPNKSKLHKNIGKPKALPTSRVIPDSSENTVEQTLSPEEAQRFELELYWCIRQLQAALKNGKLNTKQIQDHTRALNTLMSNSAPLVKKRQVMRLSFGDYRAKMAAEEKKLSSVHTRIKVSTVPPSKKSVFIKKSSFSSPGNDFRFNFPTPQKDNTENTADIKTDKINVNNSISGNNFHFTQTDNVFKFNFDLTE